MEKRVAQEGFKQILEVEKDNNETSRIQEPITRKQEKIGCDSESKRSCVSFGILDSPLGTADKRSKVCAKQLLSFSEETPEGNKRFSQEIHCPATGKR